MATFLRFNRLVRPIPSSTVCTDSERAAIVAIAAGLPHAGGDCDAPLFAGVVSPLVCPIGDRARGSGSCVKSETPDAGSSHDDPGLAARRARRRSLFAPLDRQRRRRRDPLASSACSRGAIGRLVCPPAAVSVMSARPPAFLFYPRDFLADARVELLTLEQTGAHMRFALLRLARARPRRRSDRPGPARSRRAVGVRRADLAAIAPCFEIVDGRLVQPRLERTRQAQQTASARSDGCGVSPLEPAKMKAKQLESDRIRPQCFCIFTQDPINKLVRGCGNCGKVPPIDGRASANGRAQVTACQAETGSRTRPIRPSPTACAKLSTRETLELHRAIASHDPTTDRWILTLPRILRSPNATLWRHWRDQTNASAGNGPRWSWPRSSRAASAGRSSVGMWPATGRRRTRRGGGSRSSAGSPGRNS